MIWIQVRKPEEIEYRNPLAEWFKTAAPGQIFFDFDNHSEGFIIDKALDIISGHHRLILAIDAEEQDSGQVTRFLTRLSRKKDTEILVFFNGRHEMIEKMARTIAGSRFYSGTIPEKQKEIMIEFLKDI